jgi:hypothetical protein
LDLSPAKYGTDRLVAVPVAALVESVGFCAALGAQPMVSEVGAGWRLEYAAGRSLTFTAPYRPLPANFSAGKAQALNLLLHPEHGVVPFSGRADLVNGLVDWCTSAGPGLTVRTVTGGGGSGKTRLAAQVCLAAPRARVGCGLLRCGRPRWGDAVGVGASHVAGRGQRT